MQKKEKKFFISVRETFSNSKVLSLRFQQCFGWCTMLLVEGSSETGLFKRLFNHIFRST